jgi:hypothetical protein
MGDNSPKNAEFPPFEAIASWIENQVLTQLANAVPLTTIHLKLFFKNTLQTQQVSSTQFSGSFQGHSLPF